MSFEKGTGFLQIVQNVLAEYAKTNPMNDMNKETDYVSDIINKSQDMYWEKYPTSERGDGALFDAAYGMLSREIRSIIEKTQEGNKLRRQLP
ncbi:MAG: hypothetical protein J6I73_04620 [Treponema sp.]|nr:hypothetical protein [Treponema sp.]